MLPDEHPIECYQGCCSLSKHGDGCFYPANGEPICGTWFNDDCIEHHHHFLSAEEKKLHMNQYHPNSKEIILSPGREPGPINYFNSLLPHLQLQIFSYFDIPTLVHCGLVCRSWYKLSRYSTLWCRLYLERWGVSENFDGNSNTTWIQVYRDKHVLQENWDTGNCHSSVLNGHSGWVTCVDMNNNRLISSSYDGTVRVWNTQTGNSLQVLGPLDSASPVWCTQFKSSNIIAGYSDSIVRQWNTNTAQCIREFYGHAGGVKCLQFNEENGLVFTGSDDKSVKIFDVRNGECVRTINCTDSVGKIQCHNQMLLTVIKRENNIYWYDLRANSTVKQLEGHKDAAFSLNYNTISNQLISGSRDGEIILWNMNTGEPIRSFIGHSSTVMALQLDLEKIVSGSGDRCIKIWDIETGNCTSTLLKHKEPIMSIKNDDHKIVSGSADKSVIVWDYFYPVKKKYSNIPLPDTI